MAKNLAILGMCIVGLAAGMWALTGHDGAVSAQTGAPLAAPVSSTQDAGAVVSGVVTDPLPEATPVADATVGVLVGWLGTSPILFPSAVTDPSGAYQLTGVPEGLQTLVTVTPPSTGFTPNPSFAPVVDVPAADQAIKVDIPLPGSPEAGSLREASAVTVALTGPGVCAVGEPLTLVAAAAGGAEPYSYAWREAAGNPAVGLLPEDANLSDSIQVSLPLPGAYVFLVGARDSAGVVTDNAAAIAIEAEGAPTASVAQALAAAPSGSAGVEVAKGVVAEATVLSGKVVDAAGVPVEGATVVLTPSVVDQALSVSLGMPEPVVPMVTEEPLVTDFMGAFGVAGIPDGIYVAQVALPNGAAFSEPIAVKGATDVILYQTADALPAAATFSISPADSYVAVGPVGGPFTPDFKQYTITNLTTSTLIYNINQSRGTPTMGFRLPGIAGKTALTGTLSSLASQAIEIYVLSAYAGTLPAGAYLNTVTFKDAGSNETETRQADLAVGTLSANFAASASEVVAGQSIQFTNQSTGPFTTLDWDFGDGSAHSAASNPSHTYTDYTNDPFTVTLTITGPSGSASKALPGINVYQPASAAFSYTGTPGTFIAPVTVQFNSAACQGDYAMLTWDFGDGSAPVSLNRGDADPSHTYSTANAAGYPVTLTLNGAAGNTSAVTHTVAIYASFTACFEVNVPYPPLAPSTVSFDSSCAQGVATTTVWDFGDGSAPVTQSAGDPDPSHTYNTATTYTVTMTMDGEGGLHSVASRDFTLYDSVKAQFSASTPTVVVAPGQVCFTNESFGPYNSLDWDFGDGSAHVVWNTGDPDTNKNPCHTYTDYSHDPYTVTLTAYGGGGLQDSYTLSGITVYQPPVATFTVTQDTMFRPSTVTFIHGASMGDYETLEWHFGDGSAPVTLLPWQSNPVHTYAAAGTYNPSLVLHGPAGDSAPFTLPVYVYRPYAAAFSQDKVAGPAPLTVAFTDISTGDYETVAWNFGDGSGSHPGEVQKSTTFTYTAKGHYDVSMTIGGHGGVPMVATKAALITVYAASKAHFTYTSVPPSLEMPAVVQFNSSSSEGDYTTLTWDFGDGTAPVTLDQGTPDPAHTYSVSGVYHVTLTLGGDGGTDMTAQDITVYPPLKSCFTFTSDPATRFAPATLTFDSSCAEGNFSTLKWDFGDGSDPVTLSRGAADPVHTFTMSGAYTIALTVSGAAGTKTSTQTVQVYEPIVSCFTFSPERPVVNEDITLDSACTTGDFETLDWDFGDGSTLHQDVNKSIVPITHAFAAMGDHVVTLKASGHGASNETTQTITVYSAVHAQFRAVGATSGIRPLTVAFENQTEGVATSYLWTFGDGTTSTEANPSHTYDVAGTYNVSLRAVGGASTDTEVKNGFVTVYAPVDPKFLASPSSGLVPLTVTFTDQSSGDYDKVTWDFGDESNTEETAPHGSTKPHVYIVAGTYHVTISIYDKMNVLHTKTVDVGVYTQVDAKFSATPLQGPFPLDVTFTDESTGDYDTATWDFGDGSDKAVTHPNVTRSVSHTFTKRGFFTVTLVVEGKGGKASKTLLVSAFNPVKASFTADKTSGPASLTVTFTSTSTGDLDKYVWTFGDGATGTAGPAISHTYTVPGDYNVSLSVSGGGGSDVAPKPPNVYTIHVYQPVKAAFDVSPAEGLAPLTVHFVDRSTGNPTAYAWDFDSDGTVDSTVANPTHTYATRGVYTVSLKVTGPGGSDTLVRRNVVTAFKPVLYVQPTTVNLLSVSGRDYPITVRNEGNGVLRWKATVVSGGEWMSITPTAEFIGNGEILIDYQQNLLSSARTGQISVEAADAEGSPVIVNVTQAGATVPPTPQLGVSPESRNVDSASGSTTFTVENTGGGSLEWSAEVREGNSWLSIVSGASGINKGLVKLNFTQNTLAMPRQGVVRIHGLNEGLGYVDVVVNQASAPANPELSVKPEGQSVGHEGGVTLFAVTNPDGGTLYWTAAVAPGSDWLTITDGDAGTNTGIITVLCAANESTHDRVGYIRVVSTSAPDDVLTLTVTQSGRPWLSCYGGSSSGGGAPGADAALMACVCAALFVVGRRKASRAK